ncbi:gas vesicle protein GvpJ [Kitasatospora sp. NPDC127111]|uniref:gas vesicle protein GvpJ n=1 Tax=Kitasatospora sp. NPDC127111 TaxID=3345363 RepID=UPI00363BD070
MTVAPRTGHYLDRPSSGGLVDVIDLVLDKGLIIDAYVRVSLVGIELLTIDARIVVASVDTYLRFAEAVNRLELAEDTRKGLPEPVQDARRDGARHRTRGALEDVKDTTTDVGDRVRGRGDEQEEAEEAAQRRPERRPRPAATRRERDS